MNPEAPEASPPAATDQPPGYDPEFVRLYHQTMQTYRVLMLENEKIARL